MKSTATTSEPAKIEPKMCDRCLESESRCGCLVTDLKGQWAPEVAWLASRSLTERGKIRLEKKHRYEKACKEVVRLNHRYAGMVQYFLMPVK